MKKKGMQKPIAIWALVLASAFTPILSAGKELYKPKDTLSVDTPVGPGLRFSFPNDRNINPSTSDFKSLSFVALSSESGERWAAVTITNTSSGQRFLDQGHLLALFANGRRIQPREFKEKFAGNETRTLNLYFGKKQFPLLDLYTLLDEKAR